VRVRGVLQSLGQRRGVSLASIAFAWLLRHPSRPLPVAGTRRVEALREALDALSVRLDVQEWTEVLQAAMGHEVA
jgi:predicted oxidoreductase